MELRREFRDRLARIEDRVLGMGDQVLQMAERAMTALVTEDRAIAAEVIRADDQVDRECVAVQDDILTTLALQAPVASDLRLVAALLHANIHTERMGDLCVNVARASHRAEGVSGDSDLLAQIQEMGQHARRVGRRAFEVFAARDVDAARELPALDDPVDQMNRSLFRRLVALAAQDEQQLDWALRMVLVARYLERFGDHAVDVGEQAIFAVTGEIVELASNSLRAEDL